MSAAGQRQRRRGCCVAPASWSAGLDVIGRSGPQATSSHVFDQTYEGEHPMSTGKHRRGANDPVPDVKVASSDHPGGKHADRSATTGATVPDDATHEEA